MAEDTPMLRHYFEVKAQHPEALLLYRVGDFYEMYSDDAITAVRVLGLVQTKKGQIKRKNIKIFPCMAVPGSYSFRNFNTGLYLRRIGYLAEHRHSGVQHRFMSAERKHFHRQTDRRL